MKLKPGVQALSSHPAILHAMELVDLYFRATFGRPATITSLRDGSHRADSYHFGRAGDIREQAFDFRTRDLTPEEHAQAFRDLPALLGGAFDVVEEADHGHVERDVSALVARAGYVAIHGVS